MNTFIILIVFLSLFLIINTLYVIFGIIKYSKIKKELEEYKKFSDLLSGKQNIAFKKKVDYERLCNSIDYLSYNSKVNSEDRKLTEEDFNKLKRNYPLL